MVSVTTDIDIAKYFAGEGGRVFSADVDRSALIEQSLPGASESEYLIPNMFEAD